MIRSQVLLTNGLDKEVKRLAKLHGVSKSSMIRTLLSTALNVEPINKKTQSYDIQDLNQYSLSNPRIVGFKELYSVGAKTTNIKIVTDKVFRYYMKNGKFPINFKSNLLQVLNKLNEISKNKTFVVRRAYFVPGLENPPGPRFLGLDKEEVVKAIKNIFDFAIENEYFNHEESIIEAFLYSFIDPDPISLPINSDVQLPYGGCAVPLNNSASRVEVYAVWGNNEGVQFFDSLDRYVVDTNKNIIIKKDIPQKNEMLCTTTKKQSDKIIVPSDKQFEQIMGDGEILESARVVKELNHKYALRHIEFAYDGIKEIRFLESVPYKIEPSKKHEINVKGTIVKIKDHKDLTLLHNLNSEKQIIYIDKKIVENRNFDILNSIAALDQKYMILYPGLSATAHAMRVFDDFGHTAITIGNRIFEGGERVFIKTINNQVKVEKEKDKRYTKYYVNLHDAKLYEKDGVGNKAYNLSLLKSKGFNVPHGVVITSNFYNTFLKDNFGKVDINNISLQDGELLKKLNNKKIKLDRKLLANILQESGLNKSNLFAVRSSANVEDSELHSFAGQFDSFLNVKYKDLDKYIIKVIKSLFNKKLSKHYQKLNKTSIKMPIIIQDMADAKFSGVIFGRDLQTKNEDSIVIDATSGLATGVVDGTSVTERFVYSRLNDDITHLTSNKNNILGQKERGTLIEMYNSVERLMEKPQDIEWVIDKNSNFWLIQTRNL